MANVEKGKKLVARDHGHNPSAGYKMCNGCQQIYTFDDRVENNEYYNFPGFF